MTMNPWLVESVQSFLYLKCPECVFSTKYENEEIFQCHALENHSLSNVLFGDMVKVDPISIENQILDSIKIENHDEYEEDDNSCNGELTPEISFSNPVSELEVEFSKDVDENDFPAHSETRLEDKKLFQKFKESCSKCKQCGDKFEDKRELKGHILSVHKNKELYRCSTCNVWKTAIISMKRHIVSYHDKDMTLLFYKPKELLKMNVFHKIEKSETCDQCRKKFGNKKELKEHILSVHEGKNVYICTICKACFVVLRNLKRHVVSAHGKKELLRVNFADEIEQETCEHCGDKFGNKRELKGHVLSVHEGKKVYRCTICNACFVKASRMKRHMVLSHGKENLSNTKPKELLRMNLADEIEKINCDQCGEKFLSKRELKAHILSVHEGKKVYRCSICQACFAAGGKMKRHMISDHGKEHQNFKPKELLRMNLFHEIEKPQSCNKCGDVFDSKRELKVHNLSVHEGKKLFRCSICTECFDNSSKMKNHIVSVHEKKNLMNSKPKELLCMNLFQEIEKCQPCDKCGIEFDSKRELKAHILSVHEGKKL